MLPVEFFQQIQVRALRGTCLLTLCELAPEAARPGTARLRRPGVACSSRYAIDRSGENRRNFTRKERGLVNVFDMVDEEPQRVLAHLAGRLVWLDVDTGTTSTYHARIQRLSGWMSDPQNRIRGAFRGREGTILNWLKSEWDIKIEFPDS